MSERANRKEVISILNGCRRAFQPRQEEGGGGFNSLLLFPCVALSSSLVSRVRRFWSNAPARIVWLWVLVRQVPKCYKQEENILLNIRKRKVIDRQQQEEARVSRLSPPVEKATDAPLDAPLSRRFVDLLDARCRAAQSGIKSHSITPCFHQIVVHELAFTSSLVTYSSLRSEHLRVGGV